MNLKEFNVKAEETKLAEESVIKVVKTERLMDFDINSFALVEGSDFHNGTIKVKVMSKFTEDAPEFARGFIGLAFRIPEDQHVFESWYIRPTNGNRVTDDPTRLSHGTQYFSYPKYTFAWLRENGITKYDSPADIALDEWIDLKAEIKDDTGKFYVNDKLVLTVDELLCGKDMRGGVGLFVDVGTEGYFKDLEIQCED